MIDRYGKWINPGKLFRLPDVSQVYVNRWPLEAADDDEQVTWTDENELPSHYPTGIEEV